MAFDWIQYQGSTEPVSTAKETVTESRWHQPWSEPVRQKIRPALAIALIASGVVFTPAQPFPETVTESRWHQPLSEPVRARDTLRHQITRIASGLVYVEAQPFPETVTESRWHQPWSEPVRLKLARSWYVDESAYVFSPTGEIVTVDKWFAALAAPTRRIATPAVQQPLAYSESAQFSESVSEDRWHQPWLVPTRLKPAVARTELVLVATPQDMSWQPELPDILVIREHQTPVEAQSFVYAPPAVAISLDWVAAFTDPVRVKPGLAAAAQQTLAYSESAQFPESVTEDRWHWPWSDPVRVAPRPAFADPSPYLFAPFTETITVDKWYAGFTDPVRVKLGLLAALQQALAYSESAQFAETVTADRWSYAFSEPVRAKRLPPLAIDYVPYVVAEGISVDKWFVPFADPVRLPIGLKAFLQQSAAYTNYFVPEVITLDKWFAWLAEPVRVKLALIIAAQQSAAYVGAAPFNEAVSIDRWLMGLSNPQKLAPDGVLAAAQQSFTTDTTTPSPPPPPSGDEFRVSGRSVQNLFTHDGVTYPDAPITRRTN